MSDSRSVPSVRARVRTLVADAWVHATASGSLPAMDAQARPDIEIERPSDPSHGDLAANLAMKLARPMRRSPLQIAEALATSLRELPTGHALSDVQVAAPGFINMRLSPAWIHLTSRYATWYKKITGNKGRGNER